MKKYRQAVSALVLRPSSACSPDGCTTLYEYLLVHKPRKNDAWQLPQGGIEKGESHEQAARRELQEETGLTVGDLLHLSPISYTYDFPRGFIERHHPVNDGQTLFFASFLAYPDHKVTVDKREIDRHVWILPSQLSQYIRRKEYIAVIEQIYDEALAHLPSSSHASA